MGRELTDVHMDMKSNAIMVNSNGDSRDKVHVAPKISEDSISAEDCEVKECTVENSLGEECHEKQDVLGVKHTNFAADLPDGKNEKPSSQKSSENGNSKLPGSKSGAVRNVATHQPVPQPFTLATGKRASSITRMGAEIAAPSADCSENGKNMHTPNAKRSPQPHSPLLSRKLWHSDNKKHHDEEDNWSIASSATSVRTSKSRVTVASAPTFRSTERAERRKEFYMKLEEKHQALETERSQYEERTREEQEAAIKQLRKSTVYKANPVPNFYYEGPPPKVELKKLPLTRAKSPKLNRRKSCPDAVNSSQEEKDKVCPRVQRHSYGNYKEESSAKNKHQIRVPKGNGICKVKEQAEQETTETCHCKLKEQRNADITVS